ncbi:hypothetical protein [Sporomusa sphaeroides]|uniref:hypothetical protein n=1 Tax=Sporomusa sphaeroides TaxID=47679 RepID=UPI002B9A087D|nr:hypothetical protein [Sporomusa sphaeroides]HML35200.1 hypothetical protein [Sporomusa sphaeroides]
MMLKTVYGPPPADAERIEAAELVEENCIREETAATPPAKAPRRRKGDGKGEPGKC